jgi:rhodanese-related sulfurtransferase
MFSSVFNYRKQTGSTGHQPTFRHITPAELQQQLQTDEPLLVLDVRSPEEYAGDGHIAGSRLLPLPQLYQRAGELPKNQAIVCVCRSGNRSQIACKQLAALGFTHLFNIKSRPALTSWLSGWMRASTLPTLNI